MRFFLNLETYSMISMVELYSHGDYADTLTAFNSSTAERRWSLFTPVHLKVTKGKCPICECLLDGSVTRASNNSANITINATMDHYRPKKSTLYPFLAYDHKNYIVMCADCNNLYKGCEFPLYPPSVRGICQQSITQEQPLIVNPLIDQLDDLFDIRLINSLSGRKLLELTPKHSNGYKYEKALKTIEMFCIGHYDTFSHTNSHAKSLRLEILSSHYQKFNKFIKALNNGDMKEALLEYNSNNLSEYGFTEIIKKKQFSDHT